jgi:hypothetical protein
MRPPTRRSLGCARGAQLGQRDRQCRTIDECHRGCQNAPGKHHAAALGRYFAALPTLLEEETKMRMRKWIIAAAACMLSASAIAADAPSMILVNGSVLTMDASDRVTQAIAIRDGTIVVVGSDPEIRRMAGPDSEIVDLAGRTVIPGLNDNHLHFIRAGQTFRFETYWYDASNLEEGLAQMKSAAEKRGPGRPSRRRA